MPNLIIYVLQLENEKWFLHISSSPKEYVTIECQTLFEFVQKNNPIRIFQTIKCSDKFDINTNVKIYMDYFGIDSVRGGIYSDETLPGYLIESLKSELSSSLEAYEKKTSIFNSLYNTNNVTKNDFDNKMNEYTKMVNMGYLKLNRDFFKDLEWLNDRISNLYSVNIDHKPGIFKISNEDNERYINLLKKMNEVYELYFNLDEDKINVVSTIFIKKPIYVLDKFFYNNYSLTDWNNEIDIAILILSKYEFMGYTLINILDGLEFDLYN